MLRQKRVESKLRQQITESADPNAPKAPSPTKEKGESEKVIEYRQECQLLRKQLKMAQSALTQEVGEDTPMARVLASESGWKGRAEQVRIYPPLSLAPTCRRRLCVLLLAFLL